MSVGKQTQEWIALRNKKHSEWFFNDIQALAFIDIIFEAIELTDDLIDQDIEISHDRIIKNMMNLIITLPNNDFFINNRAYFTPLLVHTLSSWIDSEYLKNSKDMRHKMLAFHLRNTSLELYHATAFLLGGFEHLRTVGVEMRTFFALETYKEWLHG